MNRVGFLGLMAVNGAPVANYGPEELERDRAKFGHQGVVVDAGSLIAPVESGPKYLEGFNT
ncbi:hypothetical protein [Sinimarinibacterium flocculans]